MSYRFHLIEVTERTGRRVAHFKDTTTGRDIFVHRLNGLYLEWDRLDKPVTNRTLRMEARDALEGKSRQVVS